MIPQHLAYLQSCTLSMTIKDLIFQDNTRTLNYLQLKRIKIDDPKSHNFVVHFYKSTNINENILQISSLLQTITLTPFQIVLLNLNIPVKAICFITET